MRKIEVLSPGLLTTVQDLGRYGYGSLGVSPSGAADSLSLRIGNRLVGNPENTPALEITLTGGAFRFPDGAAVALTGSDFEATLDELNVNTWQSVAVQPGQTLRMGHTRSGARCYLCVFRGIQVERFLDSASTHLLSGLGGFKGRALRPGDVLQIGAPPGEFTERRLNPECIEKLSASKTLRVTPGPQSDWFSAESVEHFRTTPYQVSEDSNRMGLRLVGEQISMKTPREMITEGVSLGAIQVPASGQPIILFVEQQTTGGYPKIANVISADLHSLGQLRPRDTIHFEQVSVQAARALLLEQETLLASDKLILHEKD